MGDWYESEGVGASGSNIVTTYVMPPWGPATLPVIEKVGAEAVSDVQ